MDREIFESGKKKLQIQISRYMLIMPEKMSPENNNYLLQCECQEHVRLELKTVFWEMITLNGNCSFQLIMKWWAKYLTCHCSILHDVDVSTLMITTILKFIWKIYSMIEKKTHLYSRIPWIVVTFDAFLDLPHTKPSNVNLSLERYMEWLRNF